MRIPLALSAACAALFLSSAPAVLADDLGKSGDAAHPRAPARTLVFGEGTARFEVERDAVAGRMTFRLADPAVRVEGAPVILMTGPAGSREITLTPVAGQTGVWVWQDETVKAPTFDGTMRVVVGGKTYTSPLTRVWTREWMPRHGGRVLTFSPCGASVEVVQDSTTGTLTIYSFDDVVVTEAPVITVTETTGPRAVTLTKLAGTNGAWVVKHDAFKTTTTTARVRLLVDGKPCEVPLTYGSSRGGQVVTVQGGPRFEVVQDPQGGTYTFYALDETLDGRPYTVENPTVVVGTRTYNLKPVEGEPRAWRLFGLDAAGSDARDGQLNLTLFGKTLSTRVGLSGVGIGVK